MSKPVIHLSNHFTDVFNKSLHALYNRHKTDLYKHNGKLVEINFLDDCTAYIEKVSVDRMRLLLCEAAEFYDRRGFTALPPHALLRTLLTSSDHFNILYGIVTLPILDASWDFSDESGYAPSASLYYDQNNFFDLDFLENPTVDDAHAAVELLRSYGISDFKFRDTYDFLAWLEPFFTLHPAIKKPTNVKAKKLSEQAENDLDLLFIATRTIITAWLNAGKTKTSISRLLADNIDSRVRDVAGMLEYAGVTDFYIA